MSSRDPAIADAAVRILTQAVQAAHADAARHRGSISTARHPLSVDPRLVAAEAVAACALHLVHQWAAWQCLNACSLASVAADEIAGAALLREVGEMQGTGNDVHNALAALELLDAAVRAWAPRAHPAVGLHSAGTA